MACSAVGAYDIRKVGRTDRKVQVDSTRDRLVGADNLHHSKEEEACEGLVAKHRPRLEVAA